MHMQGLNVLLIALGWLFFVVVAIIVFIWIMIIIASGVHLISLSIQRHKTLKAFKKRQFDLEEQFERAKDKWKSR